jgi:hypothetical protein
MSIANSGLLAHVVRVAYDSRARPAQSGTRRSSGPSRAFVKRIAPVRGVAHDEAETVGLEARALHREVRDQLSVRRVRGLARPRPGCRR